MAALSAAMSSCADFNVTLIPKVCEEGPLPSNFSITCTVDDNTAVLSWVITGTTTPLGGPIARSYDSPPFKYPQPTSPGEATLNVQDPNNSEVVIGTCFQCRATVGIKRTDSKKKCLSAVGELNSIISSISVCRPKKLICSIILQCAALVW